MPNRSCAYWYKKLAIHVPMPPSSFKASLLKFASLGTLGHQRPKLIRVETSGHLRTDFIRCEVGVELSVGVEHVHRQHPSTRRARVHLHLSAENIVSVELERRKPLSEHVRSSTSPFHRLITAARRHYSLCIQLLKWTLTRGYLGPADCFVRFWWKYRAYSAVPSTFTNLPST